MGNNLFGADIAGQIAAGLGHHLLGFQLLKTVEGTRSSADIAAGKQPSTKSFSCRGILESFSARQIDGTIVKSGDRKIMILGGTLPNGIVPSVQDKVLAEGSTYTITALVERDPDAASYTLAGRGS